jgi:hypothetical protein
MPAYLMIRMVTAVIAQEFPRNGMQADDSLLMKLIEH